MDIKGIRPTHRGWEVSVSHKGNRKTAVCKTKAEAKTRRAELLNQLLLQEASSARVGVTAPSTITLKEAADRSLADRWAHIKSLDAVWSYLKQVLDFLGICTSQVRLPLVPASAGLQKRLRTLVDEQASFAAVSK